MVRIKEGTFPWGEGGKVLGRLNTRCLACPCHLHLGACRKCRIPGPTPDLPNNIYMWTDHRVICLTMKMWGDLYNHPHPPNSSTVSRTTLSSWCGTAWHSHISKEGQAVTPSQTMERKAYVRLAWSLSVSKTHLWILLIDLPFRVKSKTIKIYKLRADYLFFHLGPKELFQVHQTNTSAKTENPLDNFKMFN